MSMLGSIDLFHAIAGLLVGTLVGLTGVGGGSLMTPLLVLFFGFSAKTAVGTDLLFAAITKIAGSAVHGSRETVDWRIVRRMAMGSVPAAILALILLGRVGGNRPVCRKDHPPLARQPAGADGGGGGGKEMALQPSPRARHTQICLLYTSDAADE